MKIHPVFALPLLLGSVLSAAENPPPVSPAPLLPVATQWTMNDYCRQKQIGDHDFYFAAIGNWAFTGENGVALRSLGLDRLLTPGSAKLSLFDSTTVKTAEQKHLAELYLQNR